MFNAIKDCIQTFLKWKVWIKVKPFNILNRMFSVMKIVLFFLTILVKLALDKSDETDCELVTIEGELYRKEYPPIEASGNRTHVYLSVTVQDLGSFQEISMTFRAKVYIMLKWFDKRLTFANLKKDNDERNSIGKIF